MKKIISTTKAPSAIGPYKLPGGHIDDAEMISQALSREVFEETLSG